MHHGLLRYRIVRWPFYRLVSLRNRTFAFARWSRNHIAWFVRVTWYRSFSLLNLANFALRWTANHVRWFARLLRLYAAWLARYISTHAVWLARVIRQRIDADLYRSTARGDLVVARAQALAAPALGFIPSRTVTKPSKAVPVATKAQVDAVIVIHAHHLEVLPELLDSVRRLVTVLDCAPEILITATPGRGEAAREAAERASLEATVVDVENRGRDILPFLTLAQEGRLAHALLVLKLHTKVSAHREDGHLWRTDLVNGLVDADLFARLLARAKAGEQFTAAPRAHVFGSRDWGSNLRRTSHLAQQLGIRNLPYRFRFAAGSMFWITGGLVARMAELPLCADDFEAEPLPLDGALPHALERLFGVTAAVYGTGVLATEDV